MKCYAAIVGMVILSCSESTEPDRTEVWNGTVGQLEAGFVFNIRDDRVVGGVGTIGAGTSQSQPVTRVTGTIGSTVSLVLTNERVTSTEVATVSGARVGSRITATMTGMGFTNAPVVLID